MRVPLWNTCLSALLLVSWLGSVAERMEDPLSPIIPALHLLSRSSGYIFSGTVIKVERIEPRREDAVAVMRISFRVEGAIRGVRPGQMLVVREWAGLWQSGERYRPGERVMLFLYAPSKLGLTSTVAGAAGRLRISPDGRIVVPRTTYPPQSARPPEAGDSAGTDLVTLRELARELQRERKARP